MPGRPPKLKSRARAMARRQRALALLSEGKSIFEIAQTLRCTERQVRNLLAQALETQSVYPVTLTPERIGELRQIEAEKLQMAWRKVAEAFNAADPSNGNTIARLAEASARLSERQAAMWGLNAPTRVVEESLRLSISKSDHTHKVMISWDQSLLAAPAEPVPGLLINSRASALALPPSAVELNGNGHSADGIESAPEMAASALETEANQI
jgi:hypothetical protein